MRKLTIIRQKSFVGSMGTMEIYIEDPAGEIEICGYKAILLGYLPNGATTFFDVPEGQRRLFVIAGKMSRNFCGDFVQLPEEGDVTLTGRNHFNPVAGNAYLFDNNDNAEAASYRKKGKRIGWVFFAACIAVGLAVGVAIGLVNVNSRKNAPKTFTTDYFSITLTGAFREMKQNDAQDQYVEYASSKIDLIVVGEDLSGTEYASISNSDYAKLLQKANPDQTMKENTERGMTMLEFSYEANGNTYSAIRVILKNKETFWTFNFVCRESDGAELRSGILDYAASVVFK